jgi:hypothetical protein
MTPRTPILLLAIASLGCTEKEPTLTTCDGIACGAGQYCLEVIGGEPDSGTPDDPPACTDPPAGCDGEARCDCLPDCTDCSETEDGVFCEIALP